MLQNWFKVFLYNSLHNKLFFLLTVLGLATGMTGVILSMLYWQDEHAYNRWNPNKDRVFETIIHLKDNTWAWQVAPLATHLLEKNDKVEAALYYKPSYISLPMNFQGTKLFLKQAFNTQGNFFEFFPFEISKGSATQFKSTPNAIAISEDAVKEYFGTVDPIGKVLTNGDQQYVVTTVFKNDNKSSVAPNVLIKSVEENIKNGIAYGAWGDFNYGLMLKLKDPKDAPVVEKQLYDVFYHIRATKFAKEAGISVEEFINKYGDFSFELVSLANTRLQAGKLPTGMPEGKGNITFLIINIGLSLLILVISLFNYINLSTAYAIKRAKEIGVRKVIGATNNDIVWQQILETSITTLIAMCVSFALVELLLPYYNVLLKKDMSVSLLTYLPYFIGLLLVVILLAGVFPALYIAKFDILKVLKGNLSRSQSGVWIRNTMIVLQFCIASFFIVGGIIIARQVRYTMEKDLGFHADQILNINWQESSEKKFQNYLRIKQDLMRIPGVKAVNVSTFVPGQGSGSSSSFQYKEQNIQSQNMGIDFGYLDLLQIKVVKGRDLSPDLASDTITSALLNLTAVEMMGEKDPIGKTISWNGEDLKVVGIVDNFHLFGLDGKIPPMTFFHFKTVKWMHSNISSMSVQLKADNMEQTIEAIQQYWTQKVDAERPFTYDFIDKIFARTYENYVNQRNLFAILNVVVISIALLGLFALASYTIERRFKEIAIRKVLGAESGELIFSLSRQYILLLLIGFALAIVPSYYLMQLWLNNFAFRIDIPISAYLIAFGLMLALTLLIVVSKAYSATRISALTYLKYE